MHNTLLFRLRWPVDIGRGRDQNRAKTLAVEPEPKSVSPLSRWPGLLPLARHYRACQSTRFLNLAPPIKLLRDGLRSNSEPSLKKPNTPSGKVWYCRNSDRQVR